MFKLKANYHPEFNIQCLSSVMRVLGSMPRCLFFKDDGMNCFLGLGTGGYSGSYIY
jgi:hypothetical protein